MKRMSISITQMSETDVNIHNTQKSKIKIMKFVDIYTTIFKSKCRHS